MNEDCGMLEWVENTTGLRNILLKIYKLASNQFLAGTTSWYVCVREKGTYVTGHKLKSIMQIAGKEHSYVTSSVALLHCLLLQETEGCISQQVVTSVCVLE